MIKIASWKDCIDQFCAIKITPDKTKARSLTETSKERRNYDTAKEAIEKIKIFIIELEKYTKL